MALWDAAACECPLILTALGFWYAVGHLAFHCQEVAPLGPLSLPRLAAKERVMGTVLIALFGILLPAVTLAIELATGMCAEVFFDPIPTLGHVLLVAFVPLANLLALIGAARQLTRWRTSLLWANGIAMGIALVYTLVFLPITPLGVIAIIYMGMGLLPLAPCAR